MIKKSVAVILVKDNKVLLNLRDNIPNIPYPNCWAFIGGGVEDGENEEQAARREVLEETGCQLDKIARLQDVFIREYQINTTIFLSRINVSLEQIKLTEGQDIKFFSFGEIKNLDMPRILKEIIVQNRNLIFENI
jgi:8-oxo-dGTP diphosphatase